MSNFFLDPVPVAPIIQIFETLSAGAQLHGGKKICNFRPKSPFISEMVPDLPTVVWNVYRKSGGGAIHVGSDDLEWH